jgi:ribonuclease III
MKSLELVLSDHEAKLSALIKETEQELIIISPWIKNSAVGLVIKSISSPNIKLSLYTRFHVKDFINNISDIEAFKTLLSYFKNPEIRLIPNLHAKIYISDKKRAFITSGNLTKGGMQSNIEAGIIIIDKELVSELARNVSSLMHDALLLDKVTFFTAVDTLEIDKLKKEGNKTHNKKQEDDKENISLGKRIITKSTTESLEKINSDLNVKIDLLEDVPNAAENYILEKGWDFESHGKNLSDKLMINYPNLKAIKPVLLSTAFTHPTFNNLWKNNEITFTQTRLTSIGKEVINNIFYILIFNKYGYNYKPNLITKFKAEAKVNFLKNNPLFKVFDYSKDLLTADLVTHNEVILADKIVNDTKSALFAAIYLTLGFDQTLLFVSKIASKLDINSLIDIYLVDDPKSTLMEIIQHYYRVTPTYKMIYESGSAHEKTFETVVLKNNEILAKGSGSSIKRAEKDAASNALKSSILKRYTHDWFQNKMKNVALVKRQNYKLSYHREALLKNFAEKIKLTNYDINLLNQALTHSTWCNDMRLNADYSNSILITPGSELWNNMINMFIFHSSIIPDDSIAIVKAKIYYLTIVAFEKLNMSMYYSVGKAQESLSKAGKSDCLLAVLYVYYKSLGFNHAKNFIFNSLEKEMNTIINDDISQMKDPKGQLQELLQREGRRMDNVFSVTKIEGEVHARTYTVVATLDSVLLGRGVGKSITEAENNASKEAMINITLQYNKLFANN